jgi:hypothetical protein
MYFDLNLRLDIKFADGTTISGLMKLTVDVGESAGEFVKVADGQRTTYAITKSDGRVFYTDARGYEYTCMHFASPK